MEPGLGNVTTLCPKNKPDKIIDYQSIPVYEIRIFVNPGI
jgi:hypothetical protein